MNNSCIIFSQIKDKGNFERNRRSVYLTNDVSPRVYSKKQIVLLLRVFLQPAPGLSIVSDVTTLGRLHQPPSEKAGQDSHLAGQEALGLREAVQIAISAAVVA